MNGLIRILCVALTVSTVTGCELKRLKDPGMIRYSPLSETSAMQLPPLDSVILSSHHAMFHVEWAKHSPTAITNPLWNTLHVLTFREDTETPSRTYKPGTNFLRVQTVDWTEADKGPAGFDMSPAKDQPEIRLKAAIDFLEAAIEKDRITHVVLISHGWKQDDARAHLRYAEFLNGMWRTLNVSPLGAELTKTDAAGQSAFRPLLIAVHWPSETFFFKGMSRAMDVGQSDLSQILWELVRYRHDQQKSFKIALAGHSFGNRVLLSAVEGRTDPDTVASATHFTKWDPAWAPIDLYMGFQPAMDADILNPSRCLKQDDGRGFCDALVRIRRVVLTFSAFDYANQKALVSNYLGYFGADLTPSSDDTVRLETESQKVYGSRELMQRPVWEQTQHLPVTVLSNGYAPLHIPIGLLQISRNQMVEKHEWPFTEFLRKPEHRIIKLDLSRYVHYEGTPWTYTDYLKSTVSKDRVDLADPEESTFAKIWERLGSGAHTDIYYPEVWLFMWRMVAAP